MSRYTSQYHSRGQSGSTTAPPTYLSYGGAEQGFRDEKQSGINAYRNDSGFDSSRAIANGGNLGPAPHTAAAAAGGAGVGAGANAYLQEPETPSQYTDPFDQAHSDAPPVPAVPAPYGNQGYDYDDSYHADRGYGGHGYHASQASVDDFAAAHGAYGSSTQALPLRHHAGAMGYAEDEDDEYRQMRDGGGYGYEDKSVAAHGPALFSNAMPPPPRGKDGDIEERGLLGRIGKVGAGWGGSVEEQIERRRKGVGRQRWPILSWILAIVYVAVFIVELIKAKSATGQAIQTKPQWNPMLGPPFEFLISFGARFVPCMRRVASVPTSTQLPCLNQLTQDANSYTQDQLCPIWQLCGLPDADTVGQSYRYVTPIFLHAGFIHIIFNLLVQLTLCCQIEKLLSTPLYAILYIAGGIGGNLLGASFSLPGIPSVGASGAIYTCISVELVDLVYNWAHEYRAKTRLVMSLVFAAIGFGIGLLPGLDNWAHIGGFVVGTLGGMAVCPSIHLTKKHRIIIWVCRVIGLGLLIGFFIGIGVTANSEDPSKACSWCRYLTCIPAFSQCRGTGLTTSTSTSTSPTRRALMDL
ncbi:Rhomboid family proteins [Ceraceosorus bombacis]|uniref:Rhomboid-type serine protease n=1 Tax=Ceraceosorus bombacis TaxID=401625 RepID=A0A0N7LAV9_9BASI|nr:Rhomboid family proteins [Ceraceosorus bombacis]